MRTRTGLREPGTVPAGFMKARSDRPLQGLLSLCYGNSTSHPEAPAWLQVRPLLFSKGLAPHRSQKCNPQPARTRPPVPPTPTHVVTNKTVSRHCQKSTGMAGGRTTLGGAPSSSYPPCPDMVPPHQGLGTARGPPPCLLQ